MFKKAKWIILGLVLGILINSTVAAATYSTTTLYDVIDSGIRIVVDGKELHPTDVNGKEVAPIAYNGTTYLPVRAVASALGKAVYWDGPNFTVYLGDMDGTLADPTVMLADMTYISERSPTKTTALTDNYGNRYGSAVYYNSTSYSRTYEYLLNMKYSRFRATLYVPEGTTYGGSSHLTIKADGHILYSSPDMTRASAPVQIDVNVTGYNDFEIVWENNNMMPCLADAGFYQ